MKVEENVYEKTNTEDDAAAKANDKRDRKEGLQETSAVLGKFKDVDALAQAYSALQAEFTKRSQRLKELERRTENFAASGGAERSGAEKLRKNAEAGKAKRKEFDDFLSEIGRKKASEILVETPNVGAEPVEEKMEEKAFIQEKTEGISNQPQGAEEMNESVGKEAAAQTEETAKCTEEALREENHGGVSEEGKALSSVAEKGDAAFSSEELYARASRDEKVRLKIIGEYLASLGKTGAPLTTENGGALVSPPLKARSIGDAGNMALRYFKKGEM